MKKSINHDSYSRVYNKLEKRDENYLCQRVMNLTAKSMKKKLSPLEDAVLTHSKSLLMSYYSFSFIDLENLCFGHTYVVTCQSPSGLVFDQKQFMAQEEAIMFLMNHFGSKEHSDEIRRDLGYSHNGYVYCTQIIRNEA